VSAPVKVAFLGELQQRFPSLRRNVMSRSLFEVPETSLRFYLRYSKRHPGNRTFFGLRDIDLKWLEGHRAILCFLWDDQTAPLLIPYGEFEDLFNLLTPARDGQYKAQVYSDAASTELYIAGAGRFNVDGYFGWTELNIPVAEATKAAAGQLSHNQVQTLLGAIGFLKGNDVWCPRYDRTTLDWSVTREFPIHDRLPFHLEKIGHVLSEIDVIWIRRGADRLVALFEVEHTTSIYSGLLRFNDVFLTDPELETRFTIVADQTRRSTFVKQLRRPTFERSGLADTCNFMEYDNVLDWHKRLTMQTNENEIQR
jgi:hypothetical protein